MSPGLEMDLSAKQEEALSLAYRFVVFAAGRRAGKTFLAAVWLLIKAMEPERPGVKYGPTSRVLYVAPTIGMADDLMTDLFQDIAKDYIASFNVKKLEFIMVNGRKVKLAGCDKPRSLRGGSIIALVMDEIQDINIGTVWNRVLRAACGDLKAPALFIGTPLPGTSEEWHDLYKMGLDKNNQAWGSVHCNSTDNPFIDMAAEIEQARKDGVSEAIIQQEFFASFELMTGSHFEVDNLPIYEDVPDDCVTYIAVDLHGFGNLEGLTASEVRKLDETAIAVVSVAPNNDWYIRQIKHGRWSVDETARVIAKLVYDFQPQSLGIEKGTSRNALAPYLEQALLDLGVYPNVVPLSHGNKNKAGRIFWSLQGRFERKKIKFPSGCPKWIAVLVQQLLAFPSKLVHDDLPDCLSYIDQLATAGIPQEVYDNYPKDDDGDDYEPLDEISGF